MVSKTPEELKTMDGYRAETGAYRSSSLFIEKISKPELEKLKPPYTLKPYDIREYRSLYLMFMEADTEYSFAIEAFRGSTGQWRHLSSQPWFQNGLPQFGFAGLLKWREDKHAKDVTDIIVLAKMAAIEGNVPAMKMLKDHATPFSEKKGKLKKAETTHLEAHNQRVRKQVAEMSGVISAISATRKAS